jgi:hypothetical protein
MRARRSGLPRQEGANNAGFALHDALDGVRANDVHTAAGQPSGGGAAGASAAGAGEGAPRRRME